MLANSISYLSIQIQVAFKTGETGVPLRSSSLEPINVSQYGCAKFPFSDITHVALPPLPLPRPNSSPLWGCVGKALLAAEMTVLHDACRHHVADARQMSELSGFCWAFC